MLVKYNEHTFVRNEIPPEKFPVRKESTGTCGHYSLKAVIEAKTQEKKNIRDYSGGLRSYFTHFMTPRTIRSVLDKHGIEHKVLRAHKLTKTEEIELLKKNLSDGPILLLIANGVTRDKRFSRKKALTHWHYITLRGYDDKEQMFFVYDSSCKRPQKGLVTGNVKIPYNIVIKERNLGILKIFNNYGIAVNYDG